MTDTLPARQADYLFIGNQAWLDLLNTEVIAQGRRVDLLDSFAAFVAWLQAAHVFGGDEIREVVSWDDARARRSLEQAHTFRGALRGLADQIIQRQAVSDNAVAAINAALRWRTGYPEIIATATGFERRIHGDVTAPEHLLGPIAESVMDFLCQGDWTLLKRCENPACILYFYDTTKNHTRRWCSMSGCGNRMKAAAHYRRVKAAHGQE